MDQRKHEISACIKSVGSAVTPDHLLEVEQAYTVAQLKKKGVTEELNELKKVFAERSDYLQKLKSTALIAGREVPLLRAELHKLKEKIFSLTFATERWGHACVQQEKTIADLEVKKLDLVRKATALEQQAQAITQEIRQIEDELKLLADAIVAFSQKKDEFSFGDQQDPASPSGEQEGLADLTPSQLIDSLTTMASEIVLVRTETETVDHRNKDLATTIAKQIGEIDKASARIAALQREKADLQAAIDQLLSNNTHSQEYIVALIEVYQCYMRIFEESQLIEDRHQQLVVQVNHANQYLKEALLNNNRLELSLRLEIFKQKLLFQEMEKL